MALPTVVAVGLPAGSTGSVAPSLPSGWAADDLHILITNTKRAETQVSVSGFTFLDATIPTGDNKVSVFYRDAQSGDAAPTVPDSGDHTYAVIIGFRNPNGGTCAIDGSAKDVANTATTAVSWPDFTTLGADRMILHALADGRDATGARFSGQTNANLSSLTERFDNGITSNGGGGLVLVTGTKATTGAIGNTTGTLVSATQALMTIAIEAPGSGSQTISGALFTNSQTFYGATVTPGPISLNPALFTNTQTFYGSLVTARYTLSPAKFDNLQSFYAATIALGAVTVSPPLVSNVQAFYSAIVTQGGGTQALLPSTFINEQTFYSPSVMTQDGGQEILPPLLTNDNQVFAPSVTGGVQPIVPSSPVYGGGGDYHAFTPKGRKREVEKIVELLFPKRKKKLKKKRIEETARYVANVLDIPPQAANDIVREALSGSESATMNQQGDWAEQEALQRQIVEGLWLQLQAMQEDEDIELLLLTG